jgi:hypothetical protein
LVFAWAALVGTHATAATLGGALDPTVISSWPGYVRGAPGRVAVLGQRAFVESQPGGAPSSLIVFDLVDPAAPRALGSYLGGGGNGVALRGDSALVPCRENGFRLLDTRDPRNFREISIFATRGLARVAAWRDDLGLLVDDGYGIHVVDFSDPLRPRRVGGCPVGGTATVLAQWDRYVYVCDGTYRVLDFGDPAAPRELARIEQVGTAADMAFHGDHLWLALGSGLKAVDRTVLVKPRILTTVNLARPAKGIAIAGDRAFVAAQRDGLKVFDLSDALNPRIIGRYDTPGLATGIALAGQHVVMTDQSSWGTAEFGQGIVVLDISDPTRPVRESAVPMDGLADGVALAGSQLVVADSDRLVTLDLADPQRPNYLGAWGGGSRQLNAVSTAGRYACALDLLGWMFTLDVLSASQPTVLSSYPCGTFPDGVCALGDRAGFGDNRNGLKILDLTKPTAPVLLGRLANPPNGTDGPYRIAMKGNYAYVAYLNSLDVVDLTDPATPVRVVQLDETGINALVVQGNYLYAVGSAFREFAVFDLANPRQPRRVVGLDWVRGAGALAVGGNVAAMTFYNNAQSYGVLLWDITNPAQPQRLGVGRIPGGPIGGLALSNNILYAAAGPCGVQVIDCQRPANPQLSVALALGHNAGAVSTEGTRGYVACGASGFVIADLAVPSQPRVLSTTPVAGPVTAVCPADGVAYVTAGDAGLAIYRVTGDGGTALLGNLDTPGFASDIAVTGGYALVADGGAGLQIIDVRQPASPVWVVTVPTTGIANSVVVRGTLAYLTAADFISGDLRVAGEGLLVLDVSNPRQPRLLGQCDTPGSANGLTVEGSLAYVASAPMLVPTSSLLAEAQGLDVVLGLDILDVSNPTAPWRVGGCPIGAGVARRVVVTGTRAYVACEFGGVQVFDVAAPRAPRRIGGNGSVDVFGVAAVGGQVWLGAGQDGLVGLIAMEPPPKLTVQIIATPPGDPGVTLQLRLTGLTGLSGRIQASTNLVEWDAGLPVTPQRPEVETRESSSSASRRFYRFICP